MNLQLSLKGRWFEMTKSGIKTEDYRSLTPYWCNRLLLYDGESKPVKWWGFMPTSRYFVINAIETNIKIGRITFKKFDYNIMTLGYPKSTDTERILSLEHKGIEIRTGNPEWGAEPNKLYFVILHGKNQTK